MNEKITNLSPLRAANKAQLAEFFDVSLPAVQGWIRRGCPVVQRGEAGLKWVFDLRAVAEWRYCPRSSGGDADPEAMTPMDRRLWYDGEKKRKELQVRNRELILAVEVEECTSRAYSTVAQSIFAIPDLLERKAGLSPEQAEVCELSIHDCLNDLADRLGALAPDVAT